MCPIAASEATYPFVHLADDRVDLGLTDLSTARRLRRCYMEGAMHEGFDYVWHEDKVTTTGRVEIWRC